ncbi:hypothetical protein ACLQ3B_03495 [Micromonospora sp. DT53]|uniref:hypothetical protein n=1 Tax=Micromonospora sp. DT53 TaxID=3393444 RepID=UPI003CEAD39F
MTTPVAQRPFVLSTPAAPIERHGNVDLHLPTRRVPPRGDRAGLADAGDRGAGRSALLRHPQPGPQPEAAVLARDAVLELLDAT